MLHESEEERQIAARHALLVERQDEGALGRVHDVVGVLDAFGDALVGQELAQPVAGDEGREVLVRDFGVDGHGALLAGTLDASARAGSLNSRGTLNAMRSSAVVTVSSVTSIAGLQRLNDLVDERLGRRCAGRDAEGV